MNSDSDSSNVDDETLQKTKKVRKYENIEKFLA